jgi:hypothetical protein
MDHDLELMLDAKVQGMPSCTFNRVNSPVKTENN